MKYNVKILKIEQVVADVKRFQVTKPEDYAFIPGQATYISISKEKWKHEERPFTFTSLNSDNYLEFTIKKYPEHRGVTNEIHNLKEGDELIIQKPMGYINYKGSGTFVAGGAGITPFIAILRQLKKDKKILGNKLIFSNKTDKDIIIKEELETMFGNEAIFIVTDDLGSKHHGYINEEFLKENIQELKQFFYICGPVTMVKEIKKILIKLGIKKEKIVYERL